MLHATFSKRFVELSNQFGSIKFISRGHPSSGSYVESAEWKKWATSAQSLVLAVFGPTSPQYQNFLDAFKACHGYDDEVNALKGIFFAAKEDFEGGYVFNVDLRVSGEVLGDFVALAKEALREGHKNVAAVLASAALEDALKRYAAIHGAETDGKTMQEIINSLKSKGLVSGAQKTLLDTMPKVRNLALHAEWEKLTEPEVSSLLGYVEQFLLSKYSGA